MNKKMLFVLLVTTLSCAKEELISIEDLTAFSSTASDESLISTNEPSSEESSSSEEAISSETSSENSDGSDDGSDDVDNETCLFSSSHIPDWNNSFTSLLEIDFSNDSSINNNFLEYQQGRTALYVDYNNDGYKDIVYYHFDGARGIKQSDNYTGEDRRRYINFFLQDCQGNFIPDTVNNNKFLGLVHGSNLLFGDFNTDGYVDFFLVGHGYDAAPLPGEYPVSLLSDGNGGFTEKRYTSLIGFFHGATTGDFDNDGDLDILLSDGNQTTNMVSDYFKREKKLLSPILINNGYGDFEIDNTRIDKELMYGKGTIALVDLNKDGFLDLVAGGAEYVNVKGPTNEYFPPLVIFGNGNTFNSNNYTELPFGEEKFGQITSFQFFDLNQDGTLEIIVARTKDRSSGDYFNGWNLDILSSSGNSFTDKTSQFLNVDEGPEKWIRFLDITYDENESSYELINTWVPGSSNYVRWEITYSGLIR